MATPYLEILSTQRPFYYGTDDQGRVLFSVNFTGTAKGPIADLKLEIAKVITTASLGTLAVDLFTSTHAILPTGDGPYTLINTTGGLPPIDFHNGDQLERFSFQVVVRGTNPITTETRVIAIWRALHGIRSTTLSA